MAKYTSQMLLLFAALAVVPAAVALATGAWAVAVRYAVVIGAVLAVAGPLARARCTDRMQANEALVVSALVFAVTGVAMAFPLTAYGVAPIDALFESISGVTTTGLSTLGSVQDRPVGFLFGRAWLQWVGGLGVVVLAIAFIVRSSAAAKRLGFDEREVGDFVGGTRAHARRVFRVYLVLSAATVGGAWLAGMPAFDALVHALAAVSTGGFSSRDVSLAAYGVPARAVLSLGCLAGAISLSWYYRARFGARSGRLRAVLTDTRVGSLLALIALGILLLTALGVAQGRALPAALSDATWLATSAQTTAGFSTLPPAELDAGSKLVLIGGMLIGGELGSTAGGLKVFRFLVLAQLLVLLVLRASVPPASRLPLRVGGVRVEPQEVQVAAALALAYLGVVAASWLAFLLYGHDPLDALFDVVSAVATVGLSAGTVTPELEPALKLVLCLDMLMGRVELLAFFVLVFPATWFGRRRPST